MNFNYLFFILILLFFFDESYAACYYGSDDLSCPNNAKIQDFKKMAQAEQLSNNYVLTTMCSTTKEKIQCKIMYAKVGEYQDQNGCTIYQKNPISIKYFDDGTYAYNMSNGWGVKVDHETCKTVVKEASWNYIKSDDEIKEEKDKEERKKKEEIEKNGYSEEYYANEYKKFSEKRKLRPY